MKKSERSSELSSIVFVPSPSFTLGVELEFQILDHNSFDLVPQASRLIRHSPESLRAALSLEFIQSILEVQTGICESVEDIDQDLGEVCRQSAKLAFDHNCYLFAASLHPTAIAVEQKLTEGERYKQIMHELQIVGRRFITQGIHVHVGMPDGDTAIRVCDAIQPFLPLLLALSSSSPYYQGVDTGFMSYRAKLFEAMPMAGLFGYIGSWDKFLNELHFFGQQGVVHSIKDLWWDARPHPDFGTLEIRVCDMPTRYSDILALTAFIQALVVTLCREPIRPGPYSRQLLRYNKWQGARHGLKGSFVDPTYFLATEKVSFVDAVERLVEKIIPAAIELGCHDHISKVRTILKRGTGSDQMRGLFNRYKNHKDVIQHIHQEFWN